MGGRAGFSREKWLGTMIPVRELLLFGTFLAGIGRVSGRPADVTVLDGLARAVGAVLVITPLASAAVVASWLPRSA